MPILGLRRSSGTWPDLGAWLALLSVGSHSSPVVRGPSAAHGGGRVRGSNPIQCCFGVRGCGGECRVTCDSHSPTVTAGARARTSGSGRRDPSSPLVPARHRPGPASRWWQIPMALAGPTHGRLVLGGDRCRQPSCRGSPPAPWCPEVSRRVGQQGVGHRRVGCPRYPSRGLFSPGAERRVT